MALNGGTIRDLACNNATLTLAATGATGSLGNSKNIVVNTSPPVLSNFTVGDGGDRRERFSGTSTAGSGTITIQIYAGSTATGSVVDTLTWSGFTGTGPFNWTFTNARGDLANGQQFTAKATHTSANGTSAAVTFTFISDADS
jgi:hypothetical protein